MWKIIQMNFLLFFSPMYNTMGGNKIFNYKKGINMKKWLKSGGCFITSCCVTLLQLWRVMYKKQQKIKIDKLVNLFCQNFHLNHLKNKGIPVSEEIKKQTIEQTKNIINHIDSKLNLTQLLHLKQRKVK